MHPAAAKALFAEHTYTLSPVTRPIFCTNRSESLHRSLGL